MKILSLMLSTVLVLSGCASINTSNYESSALTASEMQTIAIDGSAIMAGKYPPGKTALKIQDTGTFGKLLSDALRKRGFAVQSTGMNVNYLIDPLDGKMIRLGLITPNWRGDALYLRTEKKVVRQNLTQRID